MRPQPLSCGNKNKRTAAEKAQTRFNEAATSQLRKRKQRKRTHRTLGRFNEAATSQLRKPATSCRSRPAKRALQ